MEKKKRLLRDGKLQKRCEEQLLFTCNFCGERLSQADWQLENGICPVCMEGSPTGCAFCATCKAPLEQLSYDLQAPIETKPRSCHSVAVFEKTGKVVFDPSGESDGHEIIPKSKPAPTSPEKESPPRPLPSPKPTASPHEPLCIDIVLTCIGASVYLFFAAFGVPEDWLHDRSIAYTGGIAAFTAIIALKLCRSRLKTKRTKPGRTLPCLILAALTAITTFYSLEQSTGLNTTEVFLYTTSVFLSSYSISRLAFHRLSILLTLASVLTAGYCYETTQSGQKLVTIDGGITVAEPLSIIGNGPRYISDDTSDGVPNPPDLQYKIQIAPKLYPLIKQQYYIFRDYQEALEQLLKAPKNEKLADNYRSFLAWKNEYQEFENTMTQLVDQKFESLSRGAGEDEQLDYKAIDHVLKSGRALRVKIDYLIKKYQGSYRHDLETNLMIEIYRGSYWQDLETNETAFEPHFPWDELKADFQKELVRIRDNLRKFPLSLRIRRL